MKFSTLNKWDDPSASADLLYLAQLLEELLFDYSLDTYKPSAMNTSLLCAEALETIDLVSAGVLQRPNVQHVIDELIENLKNDAVAKDLVSLDIEHVLSVLNDVTASDHDRRVTLELLNDDLFLPRYRGTNERKLSQAVQEGHGKDVIRSLARSYITTLRNLNIHPKYLYDQTRTFFYYGPNRIRGNSDIDEYFQLFHIENREFFAVYRASKIFLQIKESCKRLDAEVTERPQLSQQLIDQHRFQLRNDEVYVLVHKIKAREVSTARELADQRMEVLQTLMTLFHHKERPVWGKDCLIVNLEQTSAKNVRKPLNPMHKCIDYKPNKASKQLNALISNFSLERESFLKFQRSTELHSLALSSDSHENQIINLWIALESLIPPRAEQGIIERVSVAIMPFLTLSYANRLLDRLIADLVNWKRGIVHDYLKKVAGSSLREKLVRLLVLPEHEDLRQEFMGKMGDFHLLRNRFFYVRESIRAPRKIARLLESHSRRVGWQLRRIYRARNTIVHAGITPTYAAILIENLHDYLDILMSTVVRLASSDGKMDSLEQVFHYVKLQHAAYSKLLTADKDEFTEDDIAPYFLKFTI